MGLRATFLSYILTLTLLLNRAASQSPLDFSNYPAAAKACMVSAATSSKCDTTSVAVFNACVCGNGGNFVTSAVQCLTSSDASDLATVYGTMSSNCADSNTPLGYTLQQFLALGGSSSSSKPSTTTVVGSSGTTKTTLTSTISHATITSAVVTTIVITPTGSGATAPLTSVLTITGVSSAPTATGTSSSSNGGGSKLSTGAIVGIAVGVPICLAIAGLIATLCWRQRRKEKHQNISYEPVAPYIAQPGHDTAYDPAKIQGQQNRFSNMSYMQQSSPDNQAWKQAPNMAPYYAPHGTSPPQTQQHYHQQQSDGQYVEMPGSTYAPQELPGQDYQGYQKK